jgi:hypothetical protein
MDRRAAGLKVGYAQTRLPPLPRREKTILSIYAYMWNLRASTKKAHALLSDMNAHIQAFSYTHISTRTLTHTDTHTHSHDHTRKLATPSNIHTHTHTPPAEVRTRRQVLVLEKDGHCRAQGQRQMHGL